MKRSEFDTQKRLFEPNIAALHAIPLLTPFASPFKGGLFDPELTKTKTD